MSCSRVVQQKARRAGHAPGFRTSCNRTLNFTHHDRDSTRDLNGTYLSVRVTRSGPNALVGESVGVV